jgi:hypothetical protein
VNGTEINLGSFLVNDDDGLYDIGNQGGVYWNRTSEAPEQLNYARWEDQKHRFNILLTSDAISKDSGVNLIQFYSNLNSGLNDESWAIDNININEESKEDYTIGTGEINNVVAAATNMVVDNSSLAKVSMASTWNNHVSLFADKLKPELTDFSAQLKGQDLATADGSELKPMADALIIAFNSWNSNSTGFDAMSRNLWDRLEEELVALNVENNIAIELGLFGSALGFLTSTTAVGLVTSSASIAGAILNIIDRQVPGTLNDILPSEIPTVQQATGVQLIVDALEKEEDQEFKDLATALQNSAVEAYEAVADYAANTRLLSMLNNFSHNKDTIIRIPTDNPVYNDPLLNDHFTDIEELGFTVNPIHNEVGNGLFRPTQTWDVRITSGERELEADVRYNLLSLPSSREDDYTFFDLYIS